MKRDFRDANVKWARTIRLWPTRNALRITIWDRAKYAHPRRGRFFALRGRLWQYRRYVTYGIPYVMVKVKIGWRGDSS